MSSETDRLKKASEARRAEVLETVNELGARVDETKVSFVGGVIAGALALFLLNRIILRRLKRLLRWGSTCNRN